MTRDTSFFKHYARVRMGLDGLSGRLLKCKRDTPDEFWAVRLDNNTWTYPDERMVLDGPGTQVARCACGWQFITDDAHSRTPVCRYCMGETGGTPRDIRNPRAYFHGARWPQQHGRQDASKERVSASGRRDRSADCGSDSDAGVLGSDTRRGESDRATEARGEKDDERHAAPAGGDRSGRR